MVRMLVLVFVLSLDSNGNTDYMLTDRRYNYRQNICKCVFMYVRKRACLHESF